VIERCCGLDVHKKTVVACVRVPGRTSAREQHVRTFGTTTAELLALRDWLGGYGVTHVAMESTGVYWRPIFYGRSAPRRERSCSYPKSAACTIAISSRRRSQRPRSSVSQNGRDLSNVLPRSSMANPVNPWTVAGLRMSVAMFQAWLGAVARRSRMVPSESARFSRRTGVGERRVVRDAGIGIEDRRDQRANPFCPSATVPPPGVRSPLPRCGRSCDQR
jgi:hypothetical protein